MSTFERRPPSQVRSTLTRPLPSVLQRTCACSQHTVSGGSCEDCAKKSQTLHRNARENAGAGVPAIVHDVLRAPGEPLDPGSRAFFETRFGHNFSGVRLHTDASAAESARVVGAHAYTVGASVVFGAGQYQPQTPEGQMLLAHELTHVVQQAGAQAEPSAQLQLGEADTAPEQQAEARAWQVMQSAQRQPLAVPAPASFMLQRTKICSKRLEAPIIGRFFNHAYIDDTGQDDCKGASKVGNYAIQTLVSGNFIRGCAAKTDRSTDPQAYPPNLKPCEPKSGVTDLSRCLRDAYNSYADPSVYVNPSGPNSNTFAATLAKACCADSSSSGLGRVPGWDHAPADPCLMEAAQRCEPQYLGMGSYLGADCIVRQGVGGPKI